MVVLVELGTWLSLGSSLDEMQSVSQFPSLVPPNALTWTVGIFILVNDNDSWNVGQFRQLIIQTIHIQNVGGNEDKVNPNSGILK